MSSNANKPSNTNKPGRAKTVAARADRLAAELRSNLKRRKEKARGATEAPAGPVDHQDKPST